MARSLIVILVSILVLSTFTQAANVNMDIHSKGEGTKDGYQYGSKVAYLPDMDGDGIYDIAVSAPFNDSGGSDAGAVFIFLGPILKGSDLSPDIANIMISGDSLENLGKSMAPGDYNGDGLTDLLIGAPGSADERGRAYIFNGGNTTNRTSSGANATFKGSWMGQRFGECVANIGDMNGDPYDDFVIGAGGGNSVFVYTGRKVLETPLAQIPELPQDRPNPVDFSSGLSSTNNTFGLGNATDGWDWAPNIYGGGGSDIHFPPLVNQGGTDTYLATVMANETDGAGDVPAVSAGYGVEFNITDEMMAALNSGGLLHVRLTWTTRDISGSGTGFEWWQGEVYWVKARIWNSTSNASYIGWDYDGDSDPSDDEDLDATTDSTLELYRVNWAWGSANTVTYSRSEDIDITGLVNGAGQYYMDAGGKLSDWSTISESLEVRIDDISIGVEFDPVAELIGPDVEAQYGKVLSGAGDVNKDGYDDILVGAPGIDEACIYYGSPAIASDFKIYQEWVLPETQGDNDTTGEPGVNDLKFNDGQWGSTNWYSVGKSKTMDIDSWAFGNLNGQIIKAYLYMEYKAPWGYNGVNWVRWSLEGDNYQRTDLQPINTNGQSRYNYGDPDGPYPLHENGLKTLKELRDLNLEFTNNAAGGGNRDVLFDWAQIWVETQMASNVTLRGPTGSEFGASVTGLGNINADNYDDVMIGAPNEEQGKGAAYVFIGGNHLVGNVTYDTAFTDLHGKVLTDRLGTSVAGAGLFSLDTIADLAIGSPGDNGTLWIVRGGPSIARGNIDDVAQYSIEGEGQGDLFSASMVALGDIDERFAGEILVGAPGWNEAPSTGPDGAVYIVYNTDEDILEEPLMVDFQPATDPVINEGEIQDFAVTLNVPEELDPTIKWSIDGHIVMANENEYRFISDFDSARTYDVNVDVDDGFRTASHSWKLTVLNVNAPPIVDFHPDSEPVLFEGDLMRFWADATDPDGDPLNFEWTFDGVQSSKDMEYFLKTDYDMAGNHMVAVKVRDQDLSVSREWNVTVIDVNRPPVIDDASPKLDPVIKGNDIQGFNVQASDPDGDELLVIWEIDDTMVATDTFDMTLVGRFVVDEHHTIKAMVTDGEYWVQQTWDLMMTGGGPPIIDWYSPPSPVHINENEDIVFWISAKDPDGDELTVKWTDGNRTGDGLSYDFRPPIHPKRFYDIDAVVSEDTDQGYFTSMSWRVIVNRAPKIVDQRPDKGSTLSSGDVLKTWIRFKDPDLKESDSETLTVQWSIGDEIIGIEKIEPRDRKGTAQAEMEFRAPFSKKGNITVSAVVSDGQLNDHVSWTFDLSHGGNSAPTAILKYDPVTPKKGELVTFDGTGSTDPENDIVNYAWTFGEGSYQDGLNATRTFDGRGVYQITLTVTDSRGNTDSVSKVIIIDGSKKEKSMESPWSLLVFILLLIIFVIFVLYQANRKGWLKGVEKGHGSEGPRKEADGAMEPEEEGDSDIEGEAGDQEGLEPEEEGDIEGGFEEIPLDEDDVD